MRPFILKLLLRLAILLVSSCVDPYEPAFTQSVNVVVVDGTITNRAEPQVIRLSRSLTVNGQPGNVPLSGAQVAVVVDSLQVIALTELEKQAGSYQLPDDFRGQVGHSYQLRFQLPDGTRYESSPQVMPAAPPITKVTARFNPTSLTPDAEGFTAAHDLFLDTQDPAHERNYYKWDWVLYEKQGWCCTCFESVYTMNNIDVLYVKNFPIYQSGDQLLEDCWTPPEGSIPSLQLRNITYDYICRTQCWEIIYSHSLNLFDDDLSDGGPILDRKVAQIPLYQQTPCLVEVRQLALTKDAHRFYKLVESQTQHTGGLADTPPVAAVGNVKNKANSREIVIGFFTASGVSTLRYWLDRKDASSPARGLFESLNGRAPQPEPPPPFGPQFIYGGPPRPPTAICTPSNSRTPYKPEDWQE